MPVPLTEVSMIEQTMPGNFWTTSLMPSVISALLVWGWSLKWPGTPALPETSGINRQARVSVIVVLVTGLMTTVIILLSPGSIQTAQARTYEFVDVIGQAIGWVLLLTPMFIAMAAGKLAWKDIQFRRSNCISSTLLGILVGLIFLFAGGAADEWRTLFTLSFLWAGLQYLVVGFGEEMLFRGYVQVRWVAALGWWRGYLFASVIMCLFHLPALMFSAGESLNRALLDTAEMIPLSLLMGYALQRTGNILAPVTIHFFLNWIQV